MSRLSSNYKYSWRWRQIQLVDSIFFKLNNSLKYNYFLLTCSVHCLPVHPEEH